MQTQAIDGRDLSTAGPGFLKAVTERDASLDGTFVFGVTSTGVYCRPSCPARRARPERMVFFLDCDTAEKAGFRPCLRCDPRTDGDRRHLVLVEQACELVRSSIAEKHTSSTIAARLGVSTYRLRRAFHEALGVSPRRYIEECRISALKSSLGRGDTVVSAVRKAGYSSHSWLYTDSAAKLGMTPATYRRGGEGMRVGYLTAVCKMGRLLVAATEHGVCAVSMGDDDDELVDALRREYPKAVVARSEEVRAPLEGVLRYFEGKVPGVRLDVHGTAFQRKVWSALLTIPYATTCSYSDVAEMVGTPSAVRAVARACASNPVPLLVPCHRVVRKDGGLGGYRFGLRRKRGLLDMERGLASGKVSA